MASYMLFVMLFVPPAISASAEDKSLRLKQAEELVVNFHVDALELEMFSAALERNFQEPVVGAKFAKLMEEEFVADYPNFSEKIAERLIETFDVKQMDNLLGLSKMNYYQNLLASKLELKQIAPYTVLTDDQLFKLDLKTNEAAIKTFAKTIGAGELVKPELDQLNSIVAKRLAKPDK